MILLFAAPMLAVSAPASAKEWWTGKNIGSNPCTGSYGVWTELCETPQDACWSFREWMGHINFQGLFPRFNGNGTVSRYDCWVRGGGFGIWRICDPGGSSLSNCPQPDPTQKGNPTTTGPSGCVGNPINVTTGNKYETATDFATAGPHVLDFARYYNSQEQTRSWIGFGWRSTYDRSIYDTGGTPRTVRVRRHDGKVLPYSWNAGSQLWTTESDIAGHLVETGSGWEFTTADDTIETYDTGGRLLTIEERGGYTRTLAYDAGGYLTTVTDSHGRQLAFTFGASGRIETVTVPGGHVYTYEYRPLVLDSSAGPGLLLERVVFPDDTPTTTADNPSLTYHYTDVPGLVAGLSGITDENGERVSTWDYDGEGRASLSEHAGGADRTTVTYNGDGTLTVTNPLGKQTTYHLDTIAGGPKITQVDGHASANCPAANKIYTYDANGYLASATDHNGVTTTYQHDAEGLELSRTEAVGTPAERTITTQWHATLRVPVQIVEPGHTTDLTYDANGRLTGRTITDTTSHSVPYSTNGQTRSWAYTWTPSGLLQSVDGPRTDVTDMTQYAYTVEGYLSSVTNALGHVTTIATRDGRGLPLTLLDANDVQTTLAYDARGRLLSRTVDPGANQATTTFDYDGVGQVTKITLPDGTALSYEYDGARRLTAVTNGLGERIEYTHDAMGNRTGEVVKAAGGTILRSHSWVYDELGRLLRDVGADTQTTVYGYDKNDNLVSVTDPLNRLTEQAFDALNRLVQVIDPLLGQTDYAYDAAGNLTSVTDPNDNQTAYVYDGFGSRIQTDSPDTGTTVYEYDSAGNLIRKTDARNAVAEYDYDALNRRTAVTFPAQPGENVTFDYDDETGGNYGVGRLTGLTDDSGSTDLLYDARGNVVSESRTIDGIVYDTDYAYDPANRLAEVTLPSGRIVAYERDNAGQVTTVVTRAGIGLPDFVVAASITYQPFGPVSSYVFGNGAQVSLSYDQDGRLTGIDTATSAQTVEDLTYTHDAAGNVVSIADDVDLARTQSFSYDDLDRLTLAQGLYGTIAYGYDAVGNRTSRSVDDGQSVLTETYSYDAFSSRLMTVTPSSGPVRDFTYGDSGHTVSDDGGLGALSTFTYDQSDRLSEVRHDGQLAATYDHNALGQRVVKDELGSATHFHFDRAGRLIAESDGLGQTVREYVYLGGVPIAVIEPGSSGPAAADIAVDNDDPEAGGSAAWIAGTAHAGYFGTDYAAREGGTGTDSFDWTPTLPWNGQYQVYARWPEMDELLGSTAHYTVHHADGTTAVEVDQREDGDRWNLLGVFPLTAGAGHGVSLSDEADPGTVVTFDSSSGHESEIIIDNTDPSTTAAGSWGSWADANAYDGSFNAAIGGGGANIFTWPAPVTQAGRYRVYAHWTSHANRATNAPYTIHHAGGTTTVQVNQQLNATTWLRLGAYDLVPGADHKVVLSDNANGYVVADGIRYVRISDSSSGEEVIVDNTSPGASKSGYWWTSSWGPHNNFGPNFRATWAGGSGWDYFTWTPTLPVAGRYKVYANWIANTNHSPNAPYTIYHAGGATTVRVSQQGGMGLWHYLGSFDMAPGANHRVHLSDHAAGQYIIADAVRFVLDDLPSRPEEAVVDNTDPGTSTAGTWESLTTGYSYGGSFNAAIGGGGANTFTWPVPVTEAGYYRIYAFWMENQNRATDAPYTVHHAGGTTTVRVNQETNGQKWVPLGSFNLAPGAGHKVVLSDDANEYVVADALRFVHESWEAVQPRSVVADAVRVVANSAEAPSYVHADHLGTPRKMTDQSGALAWDRVAMPFGETVSLTGTGTNPLRFPGQYFDSETGFHYNYFRDYDPSVGRYLQSDPIGLFAGLNTYSYAYSDPINWTDPSGLIGEPPGWPGNFPNLPLSDEKMQGMSPKELRDMHDRLRKAKNHEEAGKVRKFQKDQGFRNKRKQRKTPKMRFGPPLFLFDDQLCPILPEFCENVSFIPEAGTDACFLRRLPSPFGGLAKYGL